MKQRGFTLVELMIATTVFSVALLICTAVFLRINNFYIKGINNSRVQNAMRNTISDIAGQLQLTPANYGHSTGRFTIGLNNYHFNTTGLPEDGTTHALYKIDADAAGNDISTSPKKILLPNNSRVTEFTITESGVGTKTILYTIRLGVITAPVDPPINPNDPNTDLIFSNIGVPSNTASWRCKNGSDSQFCAYNFITTTVFRRL